jgi:hypothetical protein
LANGILYVTTAFESDWLWKPVRCRIKAQLSGPNRDDYVLVEVLDSIEKRGISGHLILASKHVGYPSLLDLPEDATVPVYVCSLRCPVDQLGDGLKEDDVALEAWGSAHATQASAMRSAGLCHQQHTHECR